MIYNFETMTFSFAIKYFINYPETYKIWETSIKFLKYITDSNFNKQELKHTYYTDIMK
jgi:hypothetical protein